ncbi:MAG: type II CAAX endopeptidase family protein [Bryobacteraceae bacterium]
MSVPRDPREIAVRVGIYIAFYFVGIVLLTPALVFIGNNLAGLTLPGFIAALAANALAMRIYERLPITRIGLQPDQAAAVNLGLGLAGGVSAACAVLGLPMAFGLARLVPTPGEDAGLWSFLFVFTLLAFGAAGEEILFRGYGFQLLLYRWGPYVVIPPLAVVFAALHHVNPNASALGLVNTAGFGIVLGYAFVRSRDLWLPIGLHFGWNMTLPLLGANVSGFRMKVTGYAVEWNAGPLWSGGEYGPEASILTSGILIALMLFLARAPVRRRISPLETEPYAIADAPPAPSSRPPRR